MRVTLCCPPVTQAAWKPPPRGRWAAHGDFSQTRRKQASASQPQAGLLGAAQQDLGPTAHPAEDLRAGMGSSELFSKDLCGKGWGGLPGDPALRDSGLIAGW